MRAEVPPPSPNEAWLLRTFVVYRARFARLYSNARGVGLVLVTRHFDPRAGFRDLAWYDAHDHVVYVVRRALAFPRANLRALLAHEIAHACDPTPDAPRAEQRADDLAERALGRKVRYDTMGVQTFGRGTYPRPLRLHR